VRSEGFEETLVDLVDGRGRVEGTIVKVCEVEVIEELVLSVAAMVAVCLTVEAC
jgi:hypothetical protein